MVECLVETMHGSIKSNSPRAPLAARASENIGAADGLPKTAYRSQSDALTAALVRGQESGVELNVYRCDVCAAWHMGKPRRDSSSGARK